MTKTMINDLIKVISDEAKLKELDLWEANIQIDAYFLVGLLQAIADDEPHVFYELIHTLEIKEKS